MADETPPGIDLAWDVARENLAMQHDLFKALDNKAQAMIALLTAALGGYVVAAKTPYERVGGGAGLLVAMALVVVAYSTSRFADAPYAATFDRYAGYPASVMKTDFIHAVLDAIDANETQLRLHTRLVNTAFLIIAVLGVAVVVLRAFGIDQRGL